jgi:hypothetical protein
MRQITVSVLAYGSPTSDGGDYTGTVNDDDWPVGVEGNDPASPPATG